MTTTEHVEVLTIGAGTRPVGREKPSVTRASGRTRSYPKDIRLIRTGPIVDEGLRFSRRVGALR